MVTIPKRRMTVARTVRAMSVIARDPPTVIHTTNLSREISATAA